MTTPKGAIMKRATQQMADAVADALISDALDSLFEVDADLPADVNERTIAAQLARHLEHALRARLAGNGWSVDCDYNRLGLDKKRLPSMAEMLTTVARRLSWSPEVLVGTSTGLVVPDVIVHRRRSGVRDGNVIACEVKRIGADKTDLAFDLVKLAGYRQDLGYEHAFLIMLGDVRDGCVVHRASTDAAEITRYVEQLEEAARVRRWTRGHERAAHRQRSLLVEKGPDPRQSVAESLSALNAMDAMGMWPTPRDPISERAVQQVRRRWAQVQRRAKQAWTR